MSKSRIFKKISNLALAIVMTVAMAIPSLGTVLVANASNTVIGWKELGLAEDTTYSTAGQNQTIGTFSTDDFTNLEFRAVINLSGWVRFGFGDNGSARTFHMQGNPDGAVYLKWNGEVIRYLNTPSLPYTDVGGDLTEVDLIVDLKYEFVKDSANPNKSTGSITVTLTDLTTELELFTETFSNRVIATKDLEATAWVWTTTDEAAKVIAKPSVVLPEKSEEPEVITPPTDSGNTQTPSTDAGNTETPSTDEGNTETPDVDGPVSDNSANVNSGANKLGDIETEKETEKETGVSLVVFIAIGVGALILIAAIVVTILVIKKKKGNKSEEQEGEVENEQI